MGNFWTPILDLTTTTASILRALAKQILKKYSVYSSPRMVDFYHKLSSTKIYVHNFFIYITFFFFFFGGGG